MRLFISFLISLSLLVPAFADELEDKWALATEIVGITTTDAMIKSTADAVWPKLESGFRLRNPAASDELFDELEAIYRQAMVEGVGQLSAVIIDFYAREFTLAELQELRGFYDSDAGQKLIVLQPKLAETVVPVMVAQMQQLMPQIIGRVIEAARKRGLDVSA